MTNVGGSGSVTGGLVFPASSQSMTYDLDGNLTFDGVWIYTWDAENRLIDMTMTNVGGIAALRLLESYLKAVRPFLARHPQETALFLNRKGQRMPYHTLLRLVHQYAGKQALEVNVTPHTFRRSCTTELIRAGANLYHVKELLGHESLETLKHYTRLTIADLKKTHEKCHPRERGHD